MNRKRISVLALALAAALTLSGCGSLWQSDPLNKLVRKTVENARDEFVEKINDAAQDARTEYETARATTERKYEFSLDDVSSIDLEWTSGSVDIYATDGEKIILVEKCSTGIAEKYALFSEVEGKELKVRWSQKGVSDVFSFSSKNLAVYLPAAAWDELSFDTVSADLTVHDALTCRELDLDTTSGTLNVKDVAADELDVESVSGSVTVSGAFREVKTESVSGGVSLILTDAAEEIKMNSVSGAQTLAVSEGSGFTLKFDSVSGTLDSALALTSQGGTYCFGDGTCRIEVETVSGDLRLRTDLDT